jgi:hypothetical protein
MFVRSNRVRITCQIYHALRERQLIDSIPVLESVIAVTRSYIFGVTMPKQGDFVTNFFLQSNYSAEAVRRILNSLVTEYQQPRSGSTTKHVQYENRPGSIVYEVLTKQNYEDIPNIKNLSMASILDFLRDRAMSEQFSSTDHFLGLSFLAVNRSSYDFMAELNERYIATFGKSEGVEYVAMEILLTLDSAAGVAKMKLPVSQQHLQQGGANLDSKGVFFSALARELFVKHFCPEPLTTGAEMLGIRYSTTGVVFAEKFHFLPTYVDSHFVEFGDHEIILELNVDPKEDPNTTEELFCGWMDHFEDSSGPMTKLEIIQYCDNMKKYPFPIAKFSLLDKLCGHLHHAAAGNVKDRRLFEFLVQLGANRLVSY